MEPQTKTDIIIKEEPVNDYSYDEPDPSYKIDQEITFIPVKNENVEEVIKVRKDRLSAMTPANNTTIELRPTRGTTNHSRVPNGIRYDRLDHLIFPTNNNSRRRCAGTGCKSVVRTECRKCRIGLCIHCFAPFHTK